MALCGGEDVLAIFGDVEPYGITVGRDAGEHLHILGIHHIEGTGVVAGSKDVLARWRQLDGTCSCTYLAVLPTCEGAALVLHLADGIQHAVERDFLHVAGSVDAQVEVAVLQYEVAHVGHHALQASEVFRFQQVDDSDAASAAHAADEQVVVVGSEHGAAEGISAACIIRTNSPFSDLSFIKLS